MDPNDFNTRYGHGLLAEIAARQGSLVVTMPDLWPVFAPRFPGASAVLVDGIEQTRLDELAATADARRAQRVIGLGGGTAIDAAKYIAAANDLPLVSVPTVASVDACFTAPAAVRVGRRVRYVGRVFPELVAIDFDVIASAPREMNRVGVGDVLSCHTGLFDWRLGAAAGREPAWDPAIAAGAEAVLKRVKDAAPGLADAEPESVRALFEGFRWVGRVERTVGHCRFEEGAEHYFAYCIEHQTGKRPPHGHLVCMGVQLISELQDNDPDGIAAFLARCGIDVSPEALGFTWDEVERALRGMAEHSKAEGHAYSVLDERPVDDAYIARCRARIATAREPR